MLLLCAIESQPGEDQFVFLIFCFFEFLYVFVRLFIFFADYKNQTCALGTIFAGQQKSTYSFEITDLAGPITEFAYCFHYVLSFHREYK